MYTWSVERQIEALIIINLLCTLSWFLPPSLLLIYLKSYVLPPSITVMLCGQAALKKSHIGWNLFSTLGISVHSLLAIYS